MPEPSKKEHRIKVPAGKVIMSEGDIDTSAYTILSGKVEVYKEEGGGRTVLARLGPGQIFGEMNLVLESARTASVMAIEDSVLRVVTRDSFARLLRTDPTKLVPLMRVLFERLRNMNAKYHYAVGRVGQVAAAETPAKAAPAPHEAPAAVPAAAPAAPNPLIGLRAVLEGITPEAARGLGGKPLALARFPFKIGRKAKSDSEDPLAYNDLHLNDPAPHHVSRNHCSINVSHTGGYFVQDRGSRLGTRVNAVHLGFGGVTNQIELTRRQNLLVLGSEDSPFQFRLNFLP